MNHSDIPGGALGSSPHPPRWAVAILARLLPVLIRDDVIGDLCERYCTSIRSSRSPKRARRWFWKETLRALAPLPSVYLRGGPHLSGGEPKENKGDSLMQVLLQDVRFGLRMLWKNPAYSVVAIVTLALGIGANTAIFSVVDSVLLSPLPYQDDDRLVVLTQSRPKAGTADIRFSVKEIEDYRSRSRTLESIAEYHDMSFILLDQGEPQRVETGVVSWSFFDLLGLQPLKGRDFRPEDEQPSAPPVLMLSHSFWVSRYGADPGIVGRTVEMNDRVHTIVGILPPVPQFPNENDVYMPTTACPFRSDADFIQTRTSRMMRVFGRTRADATLRMVRSDISSIANDLRGEYPEAYPDDLGYAVSAAKLKTALTRDARPTLLILLGTVGFVLLIVCANVANLSLARSAQREREMSVRSALGAGRGRLILQMLTESVTLSFAGGAVGVLLAIGTLGLLTDFTARFTARAHEISIDWSVLLFTLLISLGAGILFGLIPALPSSKQSAGGLRQGGGRAVGSRLGRRLRSALIVAQVAVSFTLLVGAGLMMRSVVKLAHVNPGFDPEHVLTMMIDLNWSKYNSSQTIRNFQEPLLEKVRALPGVVEASLGRSFPLNRQPLRTTSLILEGQGDGVVRGSGQVGIIGVSPRYFDTMRIPILLGRDFQAGDDAKSEGVVIVNHTMAEHFWPGQDPVGKRLSGGAEEPWLRVVGVVGDVRNVGLDSKPGDELYLNHLQSPSRVSRLVARTVGEPLRIISQVRDAVYAIDPEQPIAQVRTMEQVRLDAYASPRLTTILLGLFASLAVLITAAGIAGVVAFSVSQRTQEFGIRMALGAGSRRVLRLVVGQGIVLVVAGLSLGVAAAVGLSSMLRGLLFEVAPTDPLTFLAVGLLFLAIALVACLVPARRATSIDPLTALRCE